MTTAYKSHGYTWSDVIDAQFAAGYPNSARTSGHTARLNEAGKFRIASTLPMHEDQGTIDGIYPQQYFRQKAREYVARARKARLGE